MENPQEGNTKKTGYLIGIGALCLVAASAIIVHYRNAPQIQGPDLAAAQQKPAVQYWSSTSPLPQALELGKAAEANGYVYYMGGLEASGFIASATEYAAIITSNGTIGPFQSSTPLPYALERDLCGVVNNNFIYSIGGAATLTATTTAITTSTVLYAPLNATGSIGQWQKTTPLPTPLELQGDVAMNGYLYVIGGSSNPKVIGSGGGNGMETSTVIFAKFNANGTLGPWSITSPLMVPDYKTCPVAMNGYLYEVGGELPVSTSTVWYTKANADGTLLTWAPTTPMLYTDAPQATAALGGYLYVIAGDTTGTGGDTSTVSYAPFNANGTLGAWTIGTPIGPKVMSRNEAVSYNNDLYSLGGIYGTLGPTSTVFFNPAMATATTNH